MNRLALMFLKNLHRAPGLLWKLGYYGRNTEKYPEQEKYRHIQRIMEYAVAASNVEVQVFGKENIPNENGYLMYGNHQGLFDVVAIAVSHDGPLAAVFKKELQNVPLLKAIIACTKSFSMDREDVRQSLTVIQAVTQEVKNGRNYVIFPEGTRSRKGNEMVEFHSGSFRCALKAQCPVVPIAFIDSFRVLDQKGSAPISMQIHYLPPIFYEEYKDLKSVELAALVKSRIQAALDEFTPKTEA